MNTDLTKASHKDKIILLIVLVIAVVAVAFFLIPLIGQTPTIPEDKNPYRNKAQETSTRTPAPNGSAQQETVVNTNTNSGDDIPDDELMVN